MITLISPPLPTDPRFRDLTGRIFGRLTIIGYAPPRGYKKYWYCQCSCGAPVKAVAATSLVQGDTQSCGCLHREATSAALRTHHEFKGGSPTPEMRSFGSAKNRCTNQSNKSYASYGGRGIEFRFASFEEFLAAVGRRPSPKHTLDRVNVHGHYEPGNVRWATQREQQRNRSNNALMQVNGERRPVAVWADLLGIPAQRIYSRRSLGWCGDCSISPKLRSGCSHTS